jgi:hypothetical protein
MEQQLMNNEKQNEMYSSFLKEEIQPSMENYFTNFLEELPFSEEKLFYSDNNVEFPILSSIEIDELNNSTLLEPKKETNELNLFNFNKNINNLSNINMKKKKKKEILNKQKIKLIKNNVFPLIIIIIKNL